MTVLDGALDAYPEQAELLYARAMVAERIDRLDILESDLRSIIARDPDHAEALNALGYTLADRTDRYHEALELVERALALEPDSTTSSTAWGGCLYRLGRHEEAAEHLRRSYEGERDPVVAAHSAKCSGRWDCVTRPATYGAPPRGSSGQRGAARDDRAIRVLRCILSTRGAAALRLRRAGPAPRRLLPGAVAPGRTSLAARGASDDVIERWRAIGKLAARTGDGDGDGGGRWSGSLDWRQVREDFLLRLSGPFGQGALQVEGRPGRSS